MTQYDNTNRGVLFKNDRKTSDTHADHTGKLDVEGVPYWLNSWVKETKDGRRFMSLSIKRVHEADRNQERSPTVAQKRPMNSELDDEIPF